MILTKPQAEAIYSALRALEQFQAVTSIRLETELPGQYLWIKRQYSDDIDIYYATHNGGTIKGSSIEYYRNVNAFGLAYCVGV